MSWFKPTSRNDASIAVLLGDAPTRGDLTDAAPSGDTVAGPAPLPAPSAPVRTVVESPRLTPLKPAVDPSAPVSVLGRTLRFRGELHADEDFVLQGSIEGSIHHTQNLTIGVDGVVKGDSRARTLVVEGTVHGDLYALESICLTATATVHGNLFGPRISIAEGATFNGRVDMATAAKAARAVLERQETLREAAVYHAAEQDNDAGQDDIGDEDSDEVMIASA